MGLLARGASTCLYRTLWGAPGRPASSGARKKVAWNFWSKYVAWPQTISWVRGLGLQTRHQDGTVLRFHVGPQSFGNLRTWTVASQSTRQHVTLMWK